MGCRGLLLACLLLAASAGASAAPTPVPTPGLETDEETITVDAESLSYDQKTDTLTAVGEVLIRRGATELRAEHVEVRRATGDARATGGVSLIDPQGMLFADEMRINLEDETGEILDGEIRLTRHRYSLWGDRIEKGEGQRFRIENGRFTTCDCEEGPPDWSFSGERVEVDSKGYGHIHGGTFNVLDVPVLYLPRAVVPILRDRQSGLLFPQFGFSNRRGLQIVQPAYFAIDRSQDATLAVDIETSARVGALGQYRYALGAETDGNLNASYFNEVFSSAGQRGQVNPEVQDRSVPTSRWNVVADHRQELPWQGAVGYADAFLVSDDSFLRDINLLTVDRTVGDFNRTRRYTDSRVGLVQDLDRTQIRLEADYYQAFTQAQDLTLQRVPELRLVDQRELGGLVRTSVDFSASSWVREDGIDGFRVDVWPRLTVPIRTGLPMHASAFVGVRETAYALNEQRMRGGLNPDSTATWVLDLPAQSSREMVELGGTVGTELARVYDVGRGSLLRLKHTIEPTLSYWYVPGVNQEELPIFDDADRMRQRNLMTYGFVSRLFGRFAEDSAGEGPVGDDPYDRWRRPSAPGGVRELVRFSLTQSYDVERVIPPVGEAPGGPGGDHLSDFDLYLRATPVDAVSFGAYSSFDSSAADVSAAAFSLRILDTRSPARAGRLDNRSSATINYRFITRNLLQQVDGAALLQVSDRIGFLGGMRYDVINDRLLESIFGIRLLSACDCWGLDLTFIDKSNPSEVEVRAVLTLVGFGTAG